MLVVSWQSYYCIFCIKRVFLKPFGKSYLDIYESHATRSSENAAFVSQFSAQSFGLPPNKMVTLAD